MKYKVVKAFTDLTDRHVYSVGDKFPHADVDISEDRIKELSTDANAHGEPLIKAVKQKKRKKD